VREITKARLRDMRDELLTKLQPKTKRPLAPKTVHNLMGILRAILEDAAMLEIIERVPAMPTDELDEPEYVVMSLEAQLAALAKVEDHDKPLFLTLAETGQRPGEVRALRVVDFDRERPALHIRRHYSGRQVVRGRKSRTAEHVVPISKHLADALEQMLEDRAVRHGEPHPEAPLFVTARGVPYDERYTKIWARACVAAGVETIDPYNAFKHTLGYHMRISGASMSDIQAWFGHRTAKSTERYARDDVRVLERVREIALQARRPAAAPAADRHQTAT